MKASTLTAVANELGFSIGYIGDVLSERKGIGGKLATRLGYVRVWVPLRR